MEEIPEDRARAPWIAPRQALREQRQDGVPVIDPERPADGVADLGRRVDAEGVEDGRAEVVGADRVAGRVGGPAVARRRRLARRGRRRRPGRPSSSAASARGRRWPRVIRGVPAELADPDDQRLVEQAARRRGRRAARRSPWSAGGIRRFLSWLKLSPCVSQKFCPSSCQLTVTRPTPASTSRRASSRHWPWMCRP